MGEIREQNVEFGEGGNVFEGFLAWDAAVQGRRPVVLIAHDWAGLHEPNRERARRFAAMGYVGFAIDVYGKGVRGVPGADNSALMNPLLEDRGLLLRRLRSAAAAAGGHEAADPSRMAAIGYCFGGLCVLDLARSAAEGIRGVVCFHGIYSPPSYPTVSPMKTRVLVCHGWEDPFTPPAAALALADELTQAKADWQLHAYGHTMHAFTTEGADAPGMGVRYDSVADRRSFAAMSAFLQEVFAG